LIAQITAGAQAPPGLPSETASKIERAIEEHRGRLGIPAISVAIVKDNRIAFQRSLGMSDVENSVPAKDATVYRIASVTKSITAIAVMQLAEKGRLDLDAPIQKYAPGFPAKSHPISTRQLLAHLSGIRHYKPGEPERTDHFDTLTDAIGVFKDDPLEQEPGARYTYTTYGYTLLGLIVEGASGMTFSDYLREHVFKPAEMRNTQADDLFAIIPNRARGYRPRVYGRFDGNNRNASLMDSSYKLPAGGLVSTAEDLARFAIAVQSGVLVKQETLDRMSVSQKTRDGVETGYGYGWYIGNRGGRWSEGSISHGGVQAGFTSDLWLLPAKRFAVVILTNLEGGGRLGLGELANKIADIVLQSI
jgi:CubicO group peptidase (beta-lactamase class C family)